MEPGWAGETLRGDGRLAFRRAETSVSTSAGGEYGEWMMVYQRISSVLLMGVLLAGTGGCELFGGKQNDPEHQAAKPVHFTLGIEQKDEVAGTWQKIPVRAGNRVMIRKKPFRIVFYFDQLGPMLVNASSDPARLEMTRAGKSLDQVLLSNAAHSEDLLNPDRLMYLDNDGQYNNWLYFGPNTHRFDSDGIANVPEGGYLCRRTIESLTDGSDGRQWSVEGFPGDRLYVTFFKIERVPGSGRRIEKQRDWLTLEFVGGEKSDGRGE